MLLEGKNIIVTGGARGIGRATVIAMAKEGANVVSFSRSSADSERAVSVIEAAKAVGKGKICHIQCDVSDEDRVPKAIEEAVNFMGGLDCICLCAGISTQTPAEICTKEEMLDEYAVSVLGTHFMCRAAFPYFREKGSGSIITYSSYAGLEGAPSMPAYSAAKGGVCGYSRTLATDWAKYNIRINIVTPAIWSEMAIEWYGQKDEQGKKEADAWMAGLIPMGGRFGEAEEAANLNIFLASDKSKFITGQTIGVDGGMCFTR